MFIWPSLRWLLLLTVPFMWRLTWREFLLFCTKVGLTLSVQSSHLALFYILPAHPTDFPDYVTLSIASVLCASFLEHIFCFFPGFQSHSTRFHASPQAGPQTPGRWHWGFWWRMDTKATRWGARRIYMCLQETSLGLGLNWISAISKENIIFSILKWLWLSIDMSLNEGEGIGFPVFYV